MANTFKIQIINGRHKFSKLQINVFSKLCSTQILVSESCVQSFLSSFTAELLRLVLQTCSFVSYSQTSHMYQVCNAYQPFFDPPELSPFSYLFTKRGVQKLISSNFHAKQIFHSSSKKCLHCLYQNGTCLVPALNPKCKRELKDLLCKMGSEFARRNYK